jgi:hypothetical protein
MGRVGARVRSCSALAHRDEGNPVYAVRWRYDVVIVQQELKIASVMLVHDMLLIIGFLNYGMVR